MSKTLFEAVPDQSGRRFVVTGANSGLGEATTRALVSAGAEVVMACRSVERGQAVANELGSRATVKRLDLADLSSIRSFADSTTTFDVLINNAGVMAVPYRLTADGFEMQIGTNHLGHFALTGLLLNRVTDRVVTVSSVAHRMASVDVEDLNWQRRRYSRWRAYGQSKLANLLFTYELQRKLTGANSTVRALAAHPGYAATGLQGHTESFLDSVMNFGNSLVAQSSTQGALPQLRAATDPTVIGGQFFGPDGLMQTRGRPKVVESNSRSHDEVLATLLWARSELLTGVTFEL